MIGVKNDMQYYDWIKKYTDNNMSESDRSSFKNELKKNSLLSDEYNHYLKMIRERNKGSVDKLSQRFKEIDTELDKELEFKNSVSSLKRVYLKRCVGVAAAILLLISITLFIKTSVNINQITEQYWEEDRGLPLFMEPSSNVNLSDAMVNYQDGKYAIALERMSILNTNNKNDTLNYYMGNCLYKLDNLEKAKKMFKEVLKNKKSVFLEKAEYRLAFCYLPNNKNWALTLFKKIKNTPFHLYQIQAKEILKHIQ
jgi:hypothetical protein